MSKLQNFDIVPKIPKFSYDNKKPNIAEWVSLKEEHKLQNSDFVDLVDLISVYVSNGLEALQKVYNFFDFTKLQIQDVLIHSSQNNKDRGGILSRALAYGDWLTVEWISSLDLLIRETTYLVNVKYMRRMFDRGGRYGLQLYTKVTLTNLQTLDKSHKNVLLTAVLKKGNLEDALWCYDQIGLADSADYMDSLIVRSTYRIRGIKGLVALCRDRRVKVKYFNVVSSENEIIRRAIKNGDVVGLKWILDNFPSTHLINDRRTISKKSNIYKYVMRMGGKKGYYKIIRLFIDYFGEPEGQINWRRVNAINSTYPPVMEECISQLISHKFPSCLVDIISQYFQTY